VLAQEHHLYQVWGKALYQKGRIKRAQSLLDQAFSYYCSAIQHFDGIEDFQNLGRTYNQIGIIHFHGGDPAQAIEAYKVSKSYWAKIGEGIKEAAVCYNLGLANMDFQDVETAVDYVETAISLCEAYGCDTLKIVKYYQTLNSFASSLDRKEGIDSNFQVFLQHAVVGADTSELPELYILLGNVCLANGNILEAFQAYLTGAEIGQLQGNSVNMGIAYHNLGLLTQRLEQFDMAEMYL